MNKPRITEAKAKELVKELVKTGDLDVFVDEFGWWVFQFSRYNPYPRELFQNAIKFELKMNLSRELFDKIVSKIAEREFDR